MSEENKEFTVKDRRIFSEDKEPGGPAAEEVKSEPVEEEEAPAQEETAEQRQAEADAQLPEINFSTFVFSLNASALVNLGAIENPASGNSEKNLPLAKQTIDRKRIGR